MRLKINNQIIKEKTHNNRRKNYSYKKGFENSLTKVNEKTRKVLENELNKTETETYIKPKFEIISK